MPAVVITGIKEIDRKLKNLEAKVQKKIVRQAMRVGLKIMQKAVQAEVPVDTGLTKKSVKVRAAGKKRRGVISIDVQVVAEGGLVRKSKKGPVFYPAVVQYGRKGVAPNPFMTRAFNSHGEIVRQQTIGAIKSGIAQATRSN